MRRTWLLLLLACSEEGGPEAFLSVSETSLDFGQVPLGRNHTRRFNVKNDGAFPLQITAVTIDRASFMVFPSMATIGAQEQVELRVRFEPDRAGAHEATLSFESNDSSGATPTVALIGVGACTGLSCPIVRDAGEDADAGSEPDADPVDAAPRDADPIDADPIDADPIDTGFDAGFAGLAAHYGFEETSGALIDDSGNGNDGVPSAAGLIRGVAGRVGNAVQLEGNVGQFVVPADATLDPIAALTIEMFIYTSDLGVNQSIIGRGLNLGDDGLFVVTQCNNIYVAFSRSGVVGNASATTICNSFLPNDWVHVAIVNDGLFLSVYLDGQLAAQSMGGFLGAIAAPLYLGRKEPGVEPYAGLIDEMSWWTIARTPEEICGSALGTWSNGVCTPP